VNQSHTRNFCIIAHIDHGKSTLADRMLELTGTVHKRDMQAQLLDTMELEREKGITIKLQPVRMSWTIPDVLNASNNHQADTTYRLNLIDTPGHVDFSYEVSRSLAACEGAVLVVDASQGIQAQTLANVYLAIEAGLEIIPVLNKIDLPAADPERVAGEVAALLGINPESILRVSGKTGDGVPELLNAIVEHIPAPSGDSNAPLRALIFDSIYDDYRGVILFVRIIDGSVARHDDLTLMAARANALAVEIGMFAPKQTIVPSLETGQIGYIVTNLKSLAEARVGDTVTHQSDPAIIQLPGYRQVKPFVFAGFFPTSNERYPDLKMH
jgi:GTP-binding protein LepA